MGIYVFSKDVMLRLLRENFPAANDFGSEVIPGATEIGMRVCYAVERFFGFFTHFKVYCCGLYDFCISVNLKIVVTSFIETFYFADLVVMFLCSYIHICKLLYLLMMVFCVIGASLLI
jgi:ADP-glucose pyrophosphorylase